MNRRKALAKGLALFVLGSSSWACPSALASVSVHLIVRQYDPVPGVGLVSVIDNLAVNNAGAWLVQADTDADASSDEVILRTAGLYLRENQALVNPPGATISSFDSVNLNGSGHSGWNFFLRNQPANRDSGIYFDSRLVVQENDLTTAPQLSPNTRFSGFLDAKINETGRIAVVATVDDPLIPTTIDRALVILDLDGSGQLLSEKALAKEGQFLPGQTQAIADFGTGPHESAFNDQGQMLYFADLTGIFLTDGVIYRDLTKIAQEGSPSPVPGRSYEVLAGHALDLNNRGETVFRADLDGDIYTDDDIIVEGEELVHENEFLPTISPFRISDFGPANGPVAIDDDRNVLWFGAWDNPGPTKNEGLFLNDLPIIQNGDSVDSDLAIEAFATGEHAYAMSRNGRYIVFKAVLSDKTEAALLLVVQGPPPVPDGAHVPGNPMRAAKNANGEDIDVTWDVTGCPASRYNLFYGDLASVATLSYTGAACDLGVTGRATFTPPAGNVFFLIASADAEGVEGVHGYDSRGRARHASAGGLCGIVSQIRSSRCAQNP